MAKTLNPKGKTNGGAPAPQDGADRKNSRSREEAIQEVVKRVASLMEESKALNADIRSIKQTIVKGELGLKIADFNAVLRLYNLEGDDRKQFLDTLRETFSALGIGEQLGFLGAIEETEKKEKVTPGQTAAFGRQAFDEGKLAADNPHPAGAPAHEAWHKGFTERQTQVQGV